MQEGGLFPALSFKSGYNMIAVFKTNVKNLRQARSLTQMLLQNFPKAQVHVDLWDCDKVLRLEGNKLQPGRIKQLVQQQGFFCAELQ